MTVFQFLDDSVMPNFLKSRNKAKWGDNKIRQQSKPYKAEQGWRSIASYRYVVDLPR